MIYDITTFRARPGSTPSTLKSIEHWLGTQSAGTLLACWYSELGPLNRILLLREYDDMAALHAHREATLAEADPFGVASHVTEIACDAFAPCPGVPAIDVAVRGPVFEVRDYVMQANGIAGILDLWRPVLPARLAMSPMLTALSACSGRMPRFLHLYPWTSLDERARVRAGARSVGWPPAGAHVHIVQQEATIYLAAGFSPLR